jgi:hypothetical protein
MDDTPYKPQEGVQIWRGVRGLPPGVLLVIGRGDTGNFQGLLVDGLRAEELDKILDTCCAVLRAAMQRARR